MNKLSKKFILPSLATLLLFNANLHSDTATAESADAPIENTEAVIEGHISVGAREADPEKRELMKSRRAQEEEETAGDKTQAQQILRKASNNYSNATRQFKLAPREMVSPQFALASYAFPISCHSLVSIGDTFRTIEIEDGSHWEISSSDVYQLSLWNRGHSLVITPNYSWFSSFDYCITNKNTNTSVLANLYVGPVAFGPFSHWITNIDYFGGHVFLENQMIWCVNPQDGYIMKDWAVNDHIILGTYNSWFTSYDHILINVNMDDYVRVKQY